MVGLVECLWDVYWICRIDDGLRGCESYCWDRFWNVMCGGMVGLSFVWWILFFFLRCDWSGESCFVGFDVIVKWWVWDYLILKLIFFIVELIFVLIVDVSLVWLIRDVKWGKFLLVRVVSVCIGRRIRGIGGLLNFE